ncbi:hypothetical protein [Actinomadura soli]|uniref:hypothetical protein n=1 Tax=Actinomadura soli TaxID=2508997 RepID=UPI00197AEED4|nr:hypothetical protein [Actinomadura soli]
MTLEFYGKDDTSRNQGSPAVFVDHARGELVFQGWTETDAAVLAEISSHSRTAQRVVGANSRPDEAGDHESIGGS